MSHTVKVKIELRNRDALGRSVLRMEGTILGEGTYRLFQTEEQGWGFRLPKWKYPLIAKENGDLAYDDFKGHWGNEADINRLKQNYALQVARQAADAQGWMSEEINEGLVIYHPDGGTLTVKGDGTVDAGNFIGSACETATGAIERALGTRQEQHLKNEYFAERAHIRESS